MLAKNAALIAVSVAATLIVLGCYGRTNTISGQSATSPEIEHVELAVLARSSDEARCTHIGTEPTEPPWVQALPPQMHPARPFSMVLFSSTPIIGQFGIRVDGPAGAEVVLHPEHIGLTLKDYMGHTVGGQTRFRFDPCIAYPQAVGEPKLPNYFIGFTFDWSHLPAGMYRITASPVTNFVTNNGQPVALDERFGRVSTVVYIPPPRNRLPLLAVGQQYAVLSTLRGNLPLTDRDGKPIQAADLLGRILTVDQIDVAKVRFRATGLASVLYLPRSDSVVGLPGVYPAVEDSSVLRLRSKYLGRRVWGYGGLCVLGKGGRIQTGDPLTITGIFRTYNYMTTLHIGSSSDSGLDLWHDFDAYNPIVVTFKVPNSVTQWRGSAPMALSQDSALYFIVSDAWDFERLYSLISMQQAHPQWSQSIIGLIQKGSVRTGMTKDMISWMFGYPASFGTVDEVRRLDTWNYDAPTPFQYAVHFRHGVVVKFDPPGKLP